MRELLRRASHAAEHAPQQHADAHRFVANARLIFTPGSRSRVLFHRFPRVPRRKNTRFRPIARSRKFRRARDRGRRQKRFLPQIQRMRALAMDGSSEGPRSATVSSRETRSTARRGSKRARSRAIASS
jgi:hypothetical protein